MFLVITTEEAATDIWGMEFRNVGHHASGIARPPQPRNSNANSPKCQQHWKTWYPVLETEKAMAPHSSTLAWKIPGMEEPGRLQSMRLLRVGHEWATSLSLFIFMHWRRKWQPTPVFLPGESQGQRSLLAAVYGVAQSWTPLKRLNSSSSPEKCAWGPFLSSFEGDPWFLYIPHRHRSWWAHLQVSFQTLTA